MESRLFQRGGAATALLQIVVVGARTFIIVVRIYKTPGTNSGANQMHRAGGGLIRVHLVSSVVKLGL